MPGIIDLNSVQVLDKIPARFPPWPDIDSPFLSETYNMFARLSSYPSLGAPTVISAKQKSLTFRAGLDVHADNRDEWELELWHDFAGHWEGAKFEKIEKSNDIYDIGQLVGSFRRIYFKLSIKTPREERHSTAESRFTIRFRSLGSQDWKWAADEFGLADGTIYWQAPQFSSAGETHQLTEFIKGTDSAIIAERQSAETPDTLLWSLSIPLSGATGQNSAEAEHRLGIPTDYTRWFATARLYSPWIQPLHGKVPFQVEKDVVQAAFLRHDGMSVVVMALSGMNDTAVILRSDGEGNIMIKSRNDSENAQQANILVAVSTSYDIANSAVFYKARRMAKNSVKEMPLVENPAYPMEDDPHPNWFEEWYDGFGYCTWNSLGQNLNEQKILDALKSFRDQDITITTLIVDDNWQTLDKRDNQGQKGMVRFEADKEVFPEGLGSAISKIKHENPSIRRVAVWHTMLGYWGAISPNGELAEKYKTLKASNKSGWEWTCIHPDDIGKFYDDFYRFLSFCGVDGVKTDSQNSLDDLRDAPERRTMIKKYQDAWMIAGLRHLQARQIGCGSQCPVIMFHSMIEENSPRIIVRNSDDFFPTVESSHAWHIFCNAHNGLMMQHLHILPDWDMFQTNHPWAWYHAAARCISGGPIYITDYPGQHDKDLIKQMTGQTPRGTTVIFRPNRLAKSLNVYTGFDEPKILKVNTYNASYGSGTPIIGIFNVCQFALSEIMSLADFPGTEEGVYIVRSHVKGTTSFPAKRIDETAFFHVDLEKQGYDILTAYPLNTIEGSRGEINIANLGLIGKMSGAAAIVSQQAKSSSKASRPRLWTILKALGTWGIWIDELPNLSLETDLLATMFGKPIPLDCARVSPTNEHVLEIDLEKAWKEGNYSQTWSNDVAVELYLH